jgi:hypothetical protein
MRIHTQLHNRHHFPHNRDIRETGERHSTRVDLAAREAWDKRMPGTKWDKSQTEWETDDPF